jgi:hypothetical protein
MFSVILLSVIYMCVALLKVVMLSVVMLSQAQLLSELFRDYCSNWVGSNLMDKTL